MRIAKLFLENFRCFESCQFDFHPSFTLFLGENGSGKTSVLRAASLVIRYLLDERLTEGRAGKAPFKTTLMSNQRVSYGGKAYAHEFIEDFTYAPEIDVSAYGQCPNGDEFEVYLNDTTFLDGEVLGDQARRDGGLCSYLQKVRHQNDPAPLLAFYGAGRAWLPSWQNQMLPSAEIRPPSRWDGYANCIEERIDLKNLNTWFRDEAAARDPKGRWRQGYQTVAWAVQQILPGATGLMWSHSRSEICIETDSGPMPFSLLSDGQKVMAAMVADMAIRTVQLNGYLLPRTQELPTGGGRPELLEKVNGIVLIDELDVHLHPKWQRRIAGDLRKIFPQVQFIATSHSPQVIGQTEPECLRIHDPKSGNWEIPGQSYGMDTNWILETLMDAEVMAPELAAGLQQAKELALEHRFSEASELAQEWSRKVGNSRAIQNTLGTIERIKRLGK